MTAEINYNCSLSSSLITAFVSGNIFLLAAAHRGQAVGKYVSRVMMYSGMRILSSCNNPATLGISISSPIWFDEPSSFNHAKTCKLHKKPAARNFKNGTYSFLAKGWGGLALKNRRYNQKGIIVDKTAPQRNMRPIELTKAKAA